MLGILATTVRSVLRSARREPGFVCGVVLLLTLGLGLNAVTLGLVDRLLLRGPAGIREPEALRRVVVHRVRPGGAAITTTELGYLDYRDLLDARLLAGAAGESATSLLFGAGESAEWLQTRLVTANYFPLLGVRPELGRFFTADESEREGARLAVLSHAFWRSRFGGDPAALGQALEIESHRYVVVGVAPRGFTGTSVGRVDVFLPLEAASDEQVEGPWRTNRNFRWMTAVVRLARGASDAATTAEITARHRQGYADAPESDRQGRLELTPLAAVRGAGADGDLGVAALVGGIAAVVLLIAFANVANLFLARSLRQRDRLAVRLALGGGRARLLAEQALAGALLALGGAALAVAIALLVAGPVRTLLFPRVHWLEGGVDLRLLLALAAAAVVGGGVVGAFPLLLAERSQLARWLRGGDLRFSRTRTQGALLVAQSALSALLLVGAGLFARSFARASSLELGIEAERLLVVSARPGSSAPREDFREVLRDAVAKIPGVETTTRAAGTLPFVSSWGERLNVPGLAERPRVADGGPYIHAVEPGYFETVGTAIVEGRSFTAADRESGEPVAIVNRTMARLYWPGTSALGKCLEIGGEGAPCARIVGIAQNTRRQTIVEGDSLLYYVPIEQAPPDLRYGRLIVRTSDDDPGTLARLAEAIRRQALALEPSLRHVAARPLAEIVAPQLRAWRLGAGLFGVFGGLALVVAAVGIYSVVAFDVEGRRRELGIRAALGATSARIVELVLGDGLRLAAGGAALGLVAAGLLAPLVASFLYEPRRLDLGALGGAMLVLAAAAALAAAIPARRAARLDPSRVLRDE